MPLYCIVVKGAQILDFLSGTHFAAPAANDQQKAKQEIT